MNRYLLLAAGAIALASCTHKTEPAGEPSAKSEPAPVAVTSEVRLPADSPQLARITVTEVKAVRLPLDEVVAPGKIEANPNRVARVAMPVAGRVKRVMVGLGDAVKEGAALLTLDSPEVGAAVSALRQAQAKLDEGASAMAKAEADLARVKELFENRAIAQKEVLSAQAALAQAKSASEQAQATREESLRRLEILGLKPNESAQEIVVRAPLSGKVMELAVAAGEYRNDTSAPLMTIADLSTVYMAADVPETQIRLVTMGELVKITLSAYPNETFNGTVARIADTVDPQTRTIKVRAELRNPKGRLRPDMFGEIQHEETFRVVPVLPAGAIVQSDKQSIVYREKSKGVFEPVVVTFGKHDVDLVPILTGIQAGDRIVTDGAMLLKGSL